MAFQVIHTFTSLTGITYYMQVDWDANEIITIWDPATEPHELVLTSGEIGFNEDDIIAFRCSGTTKKTVFADLHFPYMTYLVTENSTDCGWTPPSCSFVPSGTATNATNGGNNGSVSVAVDISGGSIDTTFQYSLDGVSWQTVPRFDFLYPGTYQVYVKDNLGCQRTFLIVVGNTVINTDYPQDIPWQETNRMCFFFKLIVDGVTTAIREPLKWDAVDIIGERDADYHGYLFKHTDGNQMLGFDCPAGREVIKAEYDAKGQDGNVDFRYGYTYDGTDYNLLKGRLMLNTYKWYPDRIECTVETDDLDAAFQSRTDTPVSMKQDKTFDNEDVAVPTPYTLELHPKQIFTRLYSDRNDITYSSTAYNTAAFNYYIKPDNTEPIFADMRENFQYPLGPQIINPDEVSEYYFKCFVGGVADINLSFRWVVNMQRFSFLGDRDYQAFVYVVKKKYNATLGQTVTTKINITTTPVSGLLNLVGYGSFTINGTYESLAEIFSPGDEFFIYMEIVFEGNSNMSFPLIRQEIGIIDIKYKESSIPTNAKGWFLEDVIRHCINVTSNNHYAFRSSFLERLNANQVADGCGSKYFITNGFQIRQFDVDNRPLKVSLKKCLQAVRGTFCLGMNYANDTSGAFVRIERADYYYQLRQILAIELLESYSEEVIIEEMYNELEMGYDKYQDDGYNSLDEFNTKSSYLTPIKKNKKKLSVLSPFITSGYKIETVRRDQFNVNPSTSVTNDEDPFMIAVKRENSTDWVTEKDESFDTVTGIISPETAYNLRVSPMRTLFNWFIWLKGVFFYKEDTDVIKPTLVIQNNELVTQFNSDETCRVGDVDRATIEEKEDVAMTALATTRGIWRPERVMLKCRLNPQQVQTINLSKTGRYGTDKDHGYIMVKKPDGTWQGIWLDKISYNYATEKAEIIGKKMYETPDVEVDECCPWLVVNGCYILVNGERLIV